MLTRLEEFKIESTERFSVILKRLEQLEEKINAMESLLYDQEGEDGGNPDAPQDGE